MLELAFSSYMLNKYRNKENLDNTDNTKTNNSKINNNETYYIIGAVIQIFFFYRCYWNIL